MSKELPSTIASQRPILVTLLVEQFTVLLALCGARAKEMAVRKHQLRTATKIAHQLADALGIAPPALCW